MENPYRGSNPHYGIELHALRECRGDAWDEGHRSRDIEFEGKDREIAALREAIERIDKGIRDFWGDVGKTDG